MASRRDIIKFGAAGMLGLGAATRFAQDAAAQTGEKVWFNTHFHGGDAGAMEMIIKKIRDEGFPAPLDLTQGSITEHYAQLYNAVVAGSAPSIATCHDFRFATMAPVLYDLEKTPVGNIFELIGVPKEAFNKQALNIGNIKGVQYGVPLDFNLFGLYYNKAIFKQAGLDPEKPPRTRDEFEAACEKIKGIGKLPFHPALSGAPRFIRRSWYQLYWGNEGQLLDGDKAAFNNASGREALQYLVDMVQKRNWNKPGTDANNQFLAGELGMCFNGSWFYLTAEKSGLDYGCGEIPTFFKKQVSYTGTHNFVLPRQPNNAAQKPRLTNTVAFLKAFMPNSYMWGQYGGHLPTLTAALQDEKLRASPTWNKTLKHFYAMAEAGATIVEPSHPKIVQINDAIEPHIQSAYNGTVTVEAALVAAERSVNSAISN